MGKLRQLRGPLAPLKPMIGWLNDDKAAASRARDRVVEWRWMYKTVEWRRLRWSVLVRDMCICAKCGREHPVLTPVCKALKAEGRLSATSLDPKHYDVSQWVGDHTKAHKGNAALFFDEGNVQCLCKPCHDGAKQRQERAAR